MKATVPNTAREAAYRARPAAAVRKTHCHSVHSQPQPRNSQYRRSATPPRGGVAGLPRRASGGGRSTTTRREAGYICVNLEVATACTSELNTIKNETQQQKRRGARCDEATFE